MAGKHVILLLVYSLGLAGGQILFKLAALAVGSGGERSTAERLSGLLVDKYFIVALFVYAALTVLWVWILTLVPLSRAYPVVAVNFVLIACAGVTLFSEKMSAANWLGVILIAAGVILVSRDA